MAFFFFNDTATTEIYTLSLHDALPIFRFDQQEPELGDRVASFDHKDATYPFAGHLYDPASLSRRVVRSEEHTSELQSRQYLVCRLLLEKKKTDHRLRVSTSLTVSKVAS